MNEIKTDKDDCCFLVIKHSWRGKYKRVLSVGKMALSTFHPTSLELTNQWSYNNIEDITRSTNSPNEFSISFRKERKKGTDSLTISSEFSKLILTELYKHQSKFTKRTQDYPKKNAYKLHWSNVRLPVVLEITSYALNQLDPTTNNIVASYNYHQIESIAIVKDYETNSFVIAYGKFKRLHLFTLKCNFFDFKQSLIDWSSTFLGIAIRSQSNPITIADFNASRFGGYTNDACVTSISEFVVYKVDLKRHREPQRRVLCLSESCLLERDPQTYSICTLRPFSDIFSLVRDSKNAQAFQIEYADGRLRHYTAASRDSLLATLLDSVRGSGNRDVHVKMLPTSRNLRWVPFCSFVDEETEIGQLKLLISTPGHVFRFNSNIPYSGLTTVITSERNFFENREKIVISALQSALDFDRDIENKNCCKIEAFFQCLRRLFAGKIGFYSFTNISGIRESVGKKIAASLKLKDEAVTHAAIDMLCALMHPMHDDFELRYEQLNKTSLLMSKAFLDDLLTMWIEHIAVGTGTLIVSAMLDLLTFALCVPYSETTESQQFDSLLGLVADRGRNLFKLFQHDSAAIVKGAGLVMRALIEEGSAEIAAKMQFLALSEGSLLRHLIIALFTNGHDRKSLTQRQLSRHLIGLWCTNNTNALELLRRILPLGLIQFLESTDTLSETEIEEELLNNRDNLKIANDQSRTNATSNWQNSLQNHVQVVEKTLEHYTNLALSHWGTRMNITTLTSSSQQSNNSAAAAAAAIKERPVVLRRRREGVKATENWKLFFHKFGHDHLLVNLIWNHNTREELRIALENEIRAFNNDRELSGNLLISWNHKEFHVEYPSLANEIRIGDYYLRLLLTTDTSSGESQLIIRRSYEFFNDLYHQFLLSQRSEMKGMCLQAMSIIYGRYYDDIGPFSDTRHCCAMLDKTLDKNERDRLVIFIGKLALHERNVRDILRANGLRILLDLMTLAHLHKNRIRVHSQQTNLLECGPNMEFEQHTEWYYNYEPMNGSGAIKKGPVTLAKLNELFEANAIGAKTMVWAVGLENWKQLGQIPHLKWTLLAKAATAAAINGSVVAPLPVLNESDLAILILNTFIRMCEFYPSRDHDNAIVRPLPLVKRHLSESGSLAHFAQLLLTFEPVLVEKVAVLLHLLMEDNPAIATLYLTGVFYFILMYTGSNVLPIARFLQLAHRKQAFKTIDDYGNSNTSILGPLLPEAMVYYLDNHGPEKFAQIFLGEYDTPEAIWNSEMRRMLIEKISCHIADFVPHLQSHTTTRYIYIAIPAVRYPQLENELFCDIYYLRHLCDVSRFPNWPITDPIGLLKSVLAAWKSEVEKKPLEMTVEDAYRTLGFGTCDQPATPTENDLKKAYKKLVIKYHPDKNPEGRVQFEEVMRAYDFLCSKNSWKQNGPDSNNIVLILRTQSILFERCAEELRPYKYAGYPQLIRTIEMEMQDDNLFSKEVSILRHACELAFHTANCSALNVEEMRRDDGLGVLLDAFARCVDVLNLSSRPIDLSVQISYYIVKFITVCGRFDSCRSRFIELKQLSVQLCRILTYKDLHQLCLVTIECISSLAQENELQMQFLANGILWHLLSFVFAYDYTLDEGGVQKNVDENKQEILNQLAKSAILSCGKLAGIEKLETQSTNMKILNALESLLTKYVTRQIGKLPIEDVLKLLTSNSETPYLIWNHKCRAELRDYLEKELNGVGSGAIGCDVDVENADYGESFRYSEHECELVIGGVFVRVYNEQPSFRIEEPRQFMQSLLDSLREMSKSLLRLVSAGGDGGDDAALLPQAHAVLDAIANLIKHNSEIERCCVGHFRLLLKLLQINDRDLQIRVLRLLETATSNQECIVDVANCAQLGRLLLLLYQLPDSIPLLLSILSNLIGNSQLLRESLQKGAVLYLLNFFCNLDETRNNVRELSATVLVKMQTDPLVGPRVRLFLLKFLPETFLDAMRDNVTRSIRMFGEQHENPELIWNDELRLKISGLVRSLSADFRKSQIENTDVECNLPDLKNLIIPANELVVDGVYLRLFLANPNWVLRKPKEFLVQLLDTAVAAMKRTNSGTSSAGDDKAPAITAEHLDMIVDTIGALLHAQPPLADLVPSMGHISSLCEQLSVRQHQRHSLAVLRPLVQSRPCITVLLQQPPSRFTGALGQLLRARKDLIALSCDLLHRLFAECAKQPLDYRFDSLVQQAFDSKLVPALLDVLNCRNESLDKPTMVKAQVVNILKNMALSQNHSEQINALLNQNRVWIEYRDQKHDLFISDRPANNYLTGTAATAGYLTQTAANPISTAPPPLNPPPPSSSSSSSTQSGAATNQYLF